VAALGELHFRPPAPGNATRDSGFGSAPSVRDNLITRRNFVSASSSPTAVQRATWSPPCQRFTLRATWRTVERHDSMMLVVERLRRSSGETPSDSRPTTAARAAPAPAWPLGNRSSRRRRGSAGRAAPGIARADVLSRSGACATGSVALRRVRPTRARPPPAAPSSLLQLDPSGRKQFVYLVLQRRAQLHQPVAGLR
jgi:hypothetical protein